MTSRKRGKRHDAISPDDRKIAALLRDLDELVKLGIFEPGPKPGMFRVTVDADQLAAALYAQVMKRGGPVPAPES